MKCGCGTLPLSLRDELTLRVSANRVLRGVFGPKRDEIMEGWRKLHNKELRNFDPSPHI
jgi:hypothetical protein